MLGGVGNGLHACQQFPTLGTPVSYTLPANFLHALAAMAYMVWRRWLTSLLLYT